MSSCDFLLNSFYKYDALEEESSVHINTWQNIIWDVTNIGVNTFQINEIHGQANGVFDAFFDGVNVNITLNNTTGDSPDFGISPTMDEQVGNLSFYSLGHYFEFLLNNFQLNFADTINNNQFGELTSISYTSTTRTTISIPYEASIHNSPSSDPIDVSDFPTPGNLAVVDFISTSTHPFLSGTGQIIMHSGYPNGIIYFYFHHNTGYTSYFYQFTGGSASTGNYFGEMNAEYQWTMFPTN